MIPPIRPDDESSRLASLFASELLDTSPEERFDRYTRIAQKLYQVPIALFTLVDTDRQWFKSCIGLSVNETPREISFCGHAILNDELFVVNDTSKDHRFIDNPLVTSDPNIRFYAGFPIKLANKQKIGTLCIIDKVPRQLSQQDLSGLVDLGQILESELASIELAVNDELTGLLNRRGFLLLANNNLLLSSRSKQPATLHFFDLDGFKAVNDNFGHDIGDQLLRDFANILKASVRASDTVARLGGDEFVILMNDVNPELSKHSLRQLNGQISDYNSYHSNNPKLAYSRGSVLFDPTKPKDLEELMQSADQKMYREKLSKKTR